MAIHNKTKSNIALTNILRNGDFEVWQRGGANTLTSANGSNGYLADGWCSWDYQANYVSRQAFTASGEHPGNSQYTMRVSPNSTTWGNYGQIIENAETIKLRGKTITLVGYIKFSAASWAANPNSVTCMLASTANTADATSYNSIFNDQGSNNVTFTQGSFPTTWRKFVITYTVPTTATNLIVSFGKSTNSNTTQTDWYELSKLHLVVANGETPYPYRSYTEELRLCQRFYYQASAIIGAVGGTNTIIGRMSAPHPTVMRIAPSVTVSTGVIFYDGSGTATATGAVSNYSNTTTLQFEPTMASALTSYRPAIRLAGTGVIEVSSEI